MDDKTLRKYQIRLIVLGIGAFLMIAFLVFLFIFY